MKRLLALLPLLFIAAVQADGPRAVDLPTRPDVTQRFVFLAPERPKAAVILFAGGNGWIDIQPDGRIPHGGNFLVRSRQLFADRGLAVAVLDAPSDRQSGSYLSGFRQTDRHVADVKAVIAWLRRQTGVPVWLVGTSRGTQSAAYVATQLGVQDGGPDGLVLTSTILTDPRGRAVPEMDLEKIRIPTLVVHHRHDGCRLCAYSDLPQLMNKLTAANRKELVTFDGGIDQGDPCQARAHHGYNGIEAEVVARIAQWITTK